MFPGPAQLSVASSRARGEPGNKANNNVILSFLSDCTLTVINLCEVLEEVKEVIQVGMFLDVPELKWKEIYNQYSSDIHRKQAIAEYFISNHPAPSWGLVAESLYVFYDDGKYHGALQNLIRRYLKGRKNSIIQHLLTTCTYKSVQYLYILTLLPGIRY